MSDPTEFSARSASEAFPNVAAEMLETWADRERKRYKNLNPTMRQEFDTLAMIGHTIQRAGAGDQRVRIIEQCQPVRDEYNPGDNQRNVISRVMSGSSTLSSSRIEWREAVLNALAAAAVDDARIGTAVDADVRNVTAYKLAAERAHREAEDVLDERDELLRQNEELAARVEVFEQALGAGMGGSTKRDRRPKDRERISDNIYRRGRRFQVVYQFDGRQQQEPFDTEEQARARREELVTEGKIREAVPA